MALTFENLFRGYSLRFTVKRYYSTVSCIGRWSLFAESATFDVLVGKFAALAIIQQPHIGVCVYMYTCVCACVCM